MSKWYWPTQKGTESRLAESRSPVKVVVEGVDPGTPLARAIVKRFAGEINQFYMGQAQNYALSTIKNSTTRTKSVSGARLVYQNQHGQETVRIAVSAQVRAEMQPRKRVREPWDWVVVDLVMSDMDYVIYRGGAFLTTPVLEPVVPTSVQPLAGTAFDHSLALPDDESENPVLAYPRAADVFVVNSGGASSRVSSLRIDLRPFRALSALKLDLVGNLEWDGGSTQIGWSRDTFDNNTLQPDIPLGTVTGVVVGGGDETFTPPLSDIWPFGNEIWDITGSGGFPTFVALEDMPATVPDSIPSPFQFYTLTFHSPSGLLSSVVRYQLRLDLVSSVTSGSTITNTYNANVSVFTNSFAIAPVYGTIDPPATLERVAEVRYTLFRGNPPWGASERASGDQQHRVWESQTLYPTRWNSGMVGSALVTDVEKPGGFNLYNSYKIPLLGVLTVDLVFGAVAFEPV